MKDTEMRVRLTFTEEVLGMGNSDPNIHEEFIASKAPDAPSREEEVAALGVDEVIEKGKTIFPKEDGKAFVWDYQIKGMFKDACGMLRYISDSKSKKVTSYKKKIDGLIFINERKIFYKDADGNDITEFDSCQRPLRAQTMQGERVTLANSETIPEGSYIEFTIRTKDESLMPAIKEWLDYGIDRGFGQWRNSGKGKFTWEEIA